MPWTELRAELELLLALPESARHERLAVIAAADPDAGRELRALLAHDAEAAGNLFLEPPAGIAGGAAGLLAGADASTAAGAVPMRLGAYEVVRRLGQGGMGVVYLARRADGEYERRVAIKLIQAAVADGQLLQRFQRERQVLANLDHPGIARLIEGGTAESGQPYLVMEYVDGVSVERYCDQERLSPRERLQLFAAVCDAVQHAHQHLVVHRDLKPHNILVTANGEPKLLDFGIAKVLDPEKVSAGPDVTLDVMRLLTPAYASPEQVCGRPVTTASDVYSLGAVLYQLLTGVLPYSVDTTSAAAIERVVCTAEPKRPSETFAPGQPESSARANARGGTPETLLRTLRAELDWIVLRALRKEPRLRYASARELADDVRNYLAGMPVSAHADTVAYRVRKFVGRHRGAVAAAGLIGAALVLGFWMTWVQYRRAEQLASEEGAQRTLAEARLRESQQLAEELGMQRQAAEDRLAEAQRLAKEVETQRGLAQRRFHDVQRFSTKLIFDIYATIRPLPGANKASQAVVRLAVEHLDRLAADAQDDGQLQRELTGGYARISELQRLTGELDAALQSADKSVAAIARAEQLQPGHENNLFHQVMACANKASAHRALGQEQLAIDHYRRAIDLGSPGLDDPKAKFGLVNSVYCARAMLAEMMVARSSPEGILAEWVACRDLMESIVKRWPSADRRTEVALLAIPIAEMLDKVGRGAEARKELAAATAVLEEHIKKHPLDQVLARKARSARVLHADLRRRDGDIAMATALLERNMGETAALIQGGDADFGTRAERIYHATWLVRTLRASGDARRTLTIVDAELPLARALVAEQPSARRSRHDLAMLLRYRGELQRELRLPLEAGQSLTEALMTLEELVRAAPDFAEAQRELAVTHCELAQAHRDSATDQPDEVLRRQALVAAISHFERALQQFEQLTAVAPSLVGPSDLAAQLAAAKADLAELGG